MAAYKDLIGQKITKVTSNPGEPKTGQMWYNSTNGKLRGLGILEAWSSTSALAQDRYGAGGLGSQTAAVITGGRISPPNAVQSISEEYNGTGFVSGGSLNTARFNLGACGTEPAGLAFAGNEPTVSDKTETYNGSSWTAGNTMNTARGGLGGCGTQTAALAVGGPAGSTASESFNGSTWTATPSINTGRAGGRAMGTSTAAIFSGGEGAAPTYTLYANTEEWNGSSWSEVNDLGTAKYLMGQSGTSTAALIWGGRISATNQTATEKWDGTSWSTSPASLGTAAGYGGSAGSPSNTAALQAGSLGPSPATASAAFSQEYNVSTNTITAAAWASGATYPLTLNQLGGSGTQTAGLCFGGNLPPGNPNGSNQTKEYDGSAWTAGGNLNIGKNTGSRSGVGTQTASMAINFRNDGSPPVSPVSYIAMTNVEEYNGSSWTAGTATPDGEVEAGTCGTISAALRFGGNPGNPPGGPYANSTIYWNDSSWTSLNNMSTARSGLAPAFQGTYNAALGFGGETATPTTLSSTEEFDGTNWTAGGNLNTAAVRHCGSGTQTAALSFGGNPSVTRTEGYDGTAWSTRPSLANGRKFGGGAGSSTAALYMCGDATTHVEEFTGETTAGNITDFTTS